MSNIDTSIKQLYDSTGTEMFPKIKESCFTDLKYGNDDATSLNTIIKALKDEDTLLSSSIAALNVDVGSLADSINILEKKSFVTSSNTTTRASFPEETEGGTTKRSSFVRVVNWKIIKIIQDNVEYVQMIGDLNMEGLGSNIDKSIYCYNLQGNVAYSNLITIPLPHAVPTYAYVSTVLSHCETYDFSSSTSSKPAYTKNGVTTGKTTFPETFITYNTKDIYLRVLNSTGQTALIDPKIKIFCSYQTTTTS